MACHHARCRAVWAQAREAKERGGRHVGPVPAKHLRSQGSQLRQPPPPSGPKAEREALNQKPSFRCAAQPFIR